MKKCNRFLSFLLAFALVITTFGSDLTSMTSYALSSEEAVEEGIVPSVVFESTDNETEDNDDAELPEEDEPETVAEQDITVGEGDTIAEENAEPAVEEAKADGEEDADAEDDEEEENPDAEGEEALDPEAEEDAEAIEDAEAEDAEKKDVKEEKKVVEKEFREAVEIDGIKISLYAEPGVIPADAELKVEKVESDDEDQIQDLIDGELGEEFTVKKTYSYDINIVSSETGKKYNPEDNDTVEVRFSQVVEAAPSDISMEVYHVNDALTEAESVSDVVEKGTSIAFDAEHFSIYAVTLYFHEKAAKVSFNAGVYDINGNEITTGNTIRKVEMGTTSDLYYNILPKDVAPIINGYTFVKATINDQQINSFYTGSDNAFAEVEGASNLVVVSSTAAEPVKFFYKNTGATTYQTSNHIDLGFTDDEMPTVQYAKVTINKKPYNMTNGIDESDLGVQEKRLSLPQGTLRTVYSSDEIIFTVGVKVGEGPQAQTREYTHVCTEAENKNAYERCKNAHTYRQNDFGFDYKFNFAVDFNYGASVTYHSNFGNDQTKTYPVTWTTQTEGTQETHKVVTYAETKLPERTGYEFQGWADATGKLVYSYNNSKFTPATFKISNNEQVNLYASWKSKERETRNAYFYVLLPNESTNVPKDSSPQSTSRFYPKEGTNYHIWSGKGYKDIAAEDKDKNGNVYDISGVTTAKYIKKYDDGVTAAMTTYLKNTYGQNSGLTYQDIVWYTYKNASDNAGWHFDGYVKDVSVKVTYYKNTATDKTTKKEFTEKSGSYVIKDVTDSSINYSNPGYTFDYWTTNANGTGDKYYANEPITLRSNLILYAHWTKIPTYTVTYKDGVAGEVVFADQTYNNLKAGDPTPQFKVNGVVKDPTRDGYKFEGWDPEVKSTVDGNQDYVAKWTKLYTVKYVDGVNSEVVFADQTYNNLKAGDATPQFKVNGVANDPTRTGYDFIGWKSSNGGNWYTPVSGDEVYTAQWKYQYANYTVNWYLRGTTTPTKIQDSETRSDVKIGEKAYAKADDKDVSKLGNKFIGLEYDTTSIDNVVVNENGTAQINLYFTKIDYTVTYEYRDADDIANKSALPNNGQGITQNYNDTVNRAAAASAQGYDFVGWKFAENYGEYKKDTLVPETFSMPAENVEIYGTFSPASGTVYYVEHWTEKAEGNGYEKYGDTVTKTGTTGQPAGYSEYSITGFSYVGAYIGDKKPANVATEENTKIKADGTLTIKLYYDRNSYPVVYSYATDSIIPEGAMDLLPQGGNYKFGTTVEVEPTPYIEGYEFIGWKGTYKDYTDLDISVAPEEGLGSGLIRIIDLIINKITGDDGEKSVFEMPAAQVDMVGRFAYDYASYTVNYYLQNEALNGYDKQTDATETVTDLKTNDQAVYEVKDFGAAYSYKETQVGGNVITDDTTIKVLPDGSLVIDVYYDRVFKTVTYKYIGTAPEEANEFLPNAGEAISYWVGSEVTVADVVVLDAYDFFGWDAETEDQSALEIVDGKFNMPDTNVVFSGSFQIKKFTVTYNFKNTDGTDATPVKYEEIEYGKFVPTYSVTESQIPEGTYFDGWLDEEGNLLQNEDIAKDVVKKNREYVAQYRIPFKTTVTVVAETDGADVDTHLPYNGGKQFAELKLKLDVQVEVNDTVITSTEDSIFGTLSTLFGKALSFGSITATAENGEATLSEDVTIKVDGEDVTYKVEVDVIAGQGKDVNVEGYPTKVTDIRVTANGEDASEQFDINLNKGDTVGHLYIDPAPLKIKTYSKTFVYTGHPFTYDRIDVTGFQKDSDTNQIETATSHATGSITQVGRVRNTYSLEFDQTAKATNYEVVSEDLGWLTVTREQQEEEPPHDPETPEEVPETPGQVLGAQRAPEGAVLGARRGGTEDSANMVGRIITIVVAAGIGFTMIFLKRKKKEDEQ